MRLLLTRAAEDCEGTRAKLEAAGHTELVSPVLISRSTGEPWPSLLPEALIATSAKAFSALVAPPPDVLPVPLFLVGARTEEAARRHGFAGPATVAPDAATLLAILGKVPAMHLLYLAGVDRKPDLEDGLTASFHQLMVIEVYAAVAATALTPEAVAALRNGAIAGVLHYSRRSAAIFLALAAAAEIDTASLIHFCLSADVAAAFSGCPNARIASTPDETAMLELIGAV